MRRMQIGMWHQFDPDRFNEYGSNLIKGIEASRLNSMTDYQCLQGFCKKKSLQFGIHPPGVRNEHEHGMPKLTSIDFEARNEALRLAEAEVALAAEVKADYVLLHYPFPPIFPVKRNLRYFDLLPSLEYIESRDVSKRDLMERSRRVFAALSELSLKYRQRIVLEYDFFGDHEDVFCRLFDEFPNIGLVVDTQRVDIHSRVFPDFDPHRWLGRIAKHVYLVHHSNVEYRADCMVRHLPVLPEQACTADYGDANDYLRYLAEKNNRFHVTLEHRPELVSREQLMLCYESVAEIIFCE